MAQETMYEAMRARLLFCAPCTLVDGAAFRRAANLSRREKR